MLDLTDIEVFGHVLIKDKMSGEILVDKDNAVHYGNLSTAIAKALTGNKNAFISYMAFGNGGVIVDGSGSITYRKPNVSIAKNPNAQLYNTTYVQRMSNNANDIELDSGDVSVPGGNTLNFEDIVCQVELVQGFPSDQLAIDSATGSTGVNGAGNLIDDDTVTYVFNELGLYVGGATDTTVENFLNDATTEMITHVIFHPVQKAQNRVLEITYTLRIQMGCD